MRPDCTTMHGSVGGASNADDDCVWSLGKIWIDNLYSSSSISYSCMWALLIALVLPGCGDSNHAEDNPGLKTAVVNDFPPKATPTSPSYGYRFEKPRKGERDYGPAELIPVDLELELPKGASTPSIVVFQLMSGQAIVNSCQPKMLKSAENNVLHFEGSMESPNLPGRYSIRAEVTHTTLYRGDGKGLESVRSVVAHSPKIDITVRKAK